MTAPAAPTPITFPPGFTDSQAGKDFAAGKYGDPSSNDAQIKANAAFRAESIAEGEPWTTTDLIGGLTDDEVIANIKAELKRDASELIGVDPFKHPRGPVVALAVFQARPNRDPWANLVAEAIINGSPIPPRPSPTPATSVAASPQSAVPTPTVISPAPAVQQAAIQVLSNAVTQGLSQPADHPIHQPAHSFWSSLFSAIGSFGKTYAIPIAAGMAAAHNPTLAPAINELASSLGGTK